MDEYVYIVILNWKGAEDTIACLKSLSLLEDVKYRVVICDNNSLDGSYELIRDKIDEIPIFCEKKLVELTRFDAENYVIKNEDAVYLIQTGNNLGFSGGNNVGIRFSLNQADMNYVWLLNNDTEVTPKSLYYMLKRSQSDEGIGICGSRMVYHHDRSILQGLGGTYNRWLGTTHHYAAYKASDTAFDDDEISSRIDYVIGASMLLKKELLEVVGLLCEDYFLYFEELDITCRAFAAGFKHSISTDSIVFHKEGGSTGHVLQKSKYSDLLSIKNRVVFSKKFYPKYTFFVRIGLLGVIFNRLKRKQFDRAVYILKVFLGSA